MEMGDRVVIEIQGRIMRGVEQYENVLRRMAFQPFLQVNLTRGIIKGATVLGGYVFDDLYLDYRLTIDLANDEFKATFLLLLDEYTHQLWDSRRDLTKRKLRTFFAMIQRLDNIYSEFKAQSHLPTYPKNIIIVMAESLVQEFTDGTVEHWVGEYLPKEYDAFKCLENYGIRLEAHDIHIYARKRSLTVEGIFIHELIHHLMNVEGLGRTEDERKMLEVAKKYLPNSWIIKRFEEYVKTRLS